MTISLLSFQKTFAQIHINELLAVNSTILYDPDFGEFADIVELHNTSATPFDLSGYTLTDEPGNTDKWSLPSVVLPPGAFYVVWADGRDKHPGDTAFVAYKNALQTMTAPHAGFRLSGDGEYLGLFDPQGNVADELTYCTQAGDVSWGRSVAEPMAWHYFSDPTPGAPNSVYSSPTMEAAGMPVFSLQEGFYPIPQSLQLTTQEPDAVIRFTFDGSVPDAGSPVFTGTFPINVNLTIKARVYVPGKMPGNVVTKTYFINENHSLPVVAIASEAANLYGFDFGILQNALKDREVPATIEFFDPGTGQRAFLAGVGLRVFGSSIYNLPQRPISVRLKEKYGTEVLQYPLFEGKPIDRYSSFLLRNGGNDYNTAYFRDGLGVQLVKGKMDLDYQEYRPCMVFINGAYSGIYELRERLDEAYIGSNHAINPDHLDYLEDSLQVMSGDPYAFRELLQFVRDNDLSDTTAFDQVAEAVDLNEWMNYLIHRAFIGYQIADLNNRYWRSRDDNGRWRWIAGDLEHGFGLLGGDPVEGNTIAKLAGLSGDLPEWATVLFNRLLQNSTFRDEWIQRSAAYLNTIFQPEVTLAATDSLKNLLQSQMPRHIGRWHTPPSMAVWQGNVATIKTFLQNRPAHFRRHLTEIFGVQDSAQVALYITGQGRVVLSGMSFSENMEGPFFKNTAISLQAIPAPGHRFVAWDGVNSTTENGVLVPAGDTVITAIFAPLEHVSIIPPLIAADTTLSANAAPWYGWEDVTVLPGARLTVEAGATLLMGDGVSIEVQGGLLLDGQPDRRIAILPDPSPSSRRTAGGWSGFWGSIIAEHPSDSLLLRYTDLKGGSFGRDRNRHFSTISTYNSVLRVEHTSVIGGKAPLIARGGQVYIGHSEFQTDVPCNGFVSLYDMDGPIIEHSVFGGNYAINTDGIDLKGVTNGLVRYNKVFGFRGSNCDGIDLGIYSRNNLLEYNQIYDCSDKGISVGSQSNVLIRRNVIYDCDLGVAVKDSLAVAYIDQNTFYGNRQAVACYEKSALRGGGEAVISNSIMAASVESDVWHDSKSQIVVTYSLSDRELLPGTGNLWTNPAFVSPSLANFELAPDSPCLHTGDPATPLDPDSTRADMGAYYTHTGTSEPALIIHEFCYHPPFNYPVGDWVELHNRTDQPVDLSGWRMEQSVSSWQCRSHAIVPPGGYAVLSQDTGLFRAFHPDVALVLGNFYFDLSNKEGKIALYDATGALVHSVRYADTWPWPPLADGQGATVELNEGAEGNFPSDWRESYVLLGSPGGPNSLPPDVSALSVNEVMASNTHTLSDEWGEYDDWIELYNASGDSLNVGGVCLTDDEDMPCRWQLPLHFPSLTTLPPHGFMLLWADDAQDQGVLHAPFKLSAGGERVSVMQREGAGYVLRDRLPFGPQTPDTAWGRYPDGSADLRFMAPTPRASNVATSLIGPPQEGFDAVQVYPNPFVHEGTLNLKKIEKPCTVQLFNALGSLQYAAYQQHSEQVMLPGNGLAAGLYTVIVTDARGRRYAGRVVVAD